MKQPDWIERLRQRLHDAALTPPADGWKRIDTALPAATPATGRRITLGARRRWLAAAASLLAGALLTTLYMQPEPPAGDASRLAEITAPAPTPGPAASEEPAAATAPADGTHVAAAVRTGVDAAPAARSEAHPKVRPAADKTADKAVSEAAGDVAGEAAATAVPMAQKADPMPQTETPAVRRQTPSDAERRAYAEALHAQAAESRTAAGRQQTKRQTGVALFGSSSPASRSAARPTGILMNDSFQYAFNTGSFTANSEDMAARRRIDYLQGDFDHSQPWSLGLNIRYGFGHGLSLESGLLYTQLRSKVLIRGEAYAQRLHMLGIPLHLNWAFVDRPRVGLYLGGGGMLERCIGARLGDAHPAETRIQASLAALLGAEYRFSRHAALYCEPEWSYYLTETRLRTIRTEHPFTFTLRGGVRFTF